ncbi:MAG: class I SAM-dependent DNA methyltransferase [Opitutae bacterium]|nr:class I SAM-dependent DNA methyltransferase [Opitutae bacterium]
MPNPEQVAQFIDQWSKVTASERSTAQSFLNELCDLIGAPRPTATADYQFELPVPYTPPAGKKTTKYIDLYKRGCFVLEAKKYTDRPAEPTELALALDDGPARRTGVTRGTGQWDAAMQKAFEQAEWYAHHLPGDEPSPPFLLVVDVGHVIELYADFSGRSRNYTAYPDPTSHRIPLAALAKSEERERLRILFTDPAQLDPSQHAAAVTREIAGHLATLAKSLEKAGHPPKLVAEFLCRCLFCMFAEDVGLLPSKSFRNFLESFRQNTGSFVPLMEALFREMDKGASVSTMLRQKLLRFNGGLFREQTVLPVNDTQLGLLIAAAKCDWHLVEPAIFGTLLERALSDTERGKLGAHFTPRAYVERLVLPTVIDPLREDWRAARDEAVTLANRDDLAAARKVVRAFHDKLCAVRVLDPACGSGNFLYVTLDHLKRLEGEVLELLRRFGGTKDPDPTVDPHQLLGLELNERAVPIAELVLWIGYLQWHFRVHGKVLPAEPVLKEFKNIQHADAVLAYDGHPKGITGKMAEANPKLPGLPDNWRQKVAAHTGAIFVWDRKSMKDDPATGRKVPDETRSIQLFAYQNPRPAGWPKADFIVGNPPFLGKGKLREDLGDGYAETLRSVYPDVPESADFVMYWWHKAAELVAAGKVRRFGFITTNSLTQTFARRVVQRALDRDVGLVFAVPDHPWVDTADGAAVRIAMTTAEKGAQSGQLLHVTDEKTSADGSAEIILSSEFGRINADISIGTNLSAAITLKANEGITSMGVMLAGSGFILSPEEAENLSKLESNAIGVVVHRYRNGKDLTDQPRRAFVIDFCGLTADEARRKYPKTFEIVASRVKPERDGNRDSQFREKWWLFGRVRPEFRALTKGLKRYAVTVETSKHRHFQFLETGILPDHRLIAFGTDDAFHLGVLSSRIHVGFALSAGGTLEDRPVYNKSRCFDPFPFPDCTEKQKAKIRKLAEELDAHRKRAQQKHGLGLTDIYNVLEKMRGGETLSAKDKAVHDAALVATLKQLHNDLDLAVAEAYGWPWPMSDTEILKRVVELNAARAAEEKSGSIRWLRPDYQAKGELMLEGGTAPQKSGPKAPPTKKAGKLAWPAKPADRTVAVEAALAQAEEPQTAAGLTRQFSRAKTADMQEILDTLCALGRVRPGDKAGTYVR